MALTAKQKNYIRKNTGKLEISQIAADLSLPNSTVLNYLKSSLTEKNFRKISGNNSEPKTDSDLGQKFNFKQFFYENIYIFSAFFILIFIVYYNSFDNAFVSDDIASIPSNTALLNFGNLKSYTYWSALPNFILVNLSLSAPFFFRLVNLLFHFGSVCLVFCIFSLLFKKRIALFTALLFAVHPILIESVAWISGRPYSQSSFFFLASFLCYLIYSKMDRTSIKLHALSIAFFFLATLSSEKAIALLAIFPLYELSFGNFRKNWKMIWPYFLIASVFAVLYLGKTGQRIADLNTGFYQDAGGYYNPLVQIPIAISSYLGLIFWPDGLTLYHSEMSFSTGQYILSLSVFLFFLGLIYYGWKKNRFVFFWLSFFFISLTPTLTPLKVSWIVAERYVYIGTLGILAVVAYYLDKLAQNRVWGKPVYTALSILLLFLSVRTIIRNIDWESQDNLWIATSKTSPSSPVNHNNMGDVYARNGDNAKAIEEFKKAIEINPRYADAYHNLANTYQATGDNVQAIENYQKALEYNPKLWQSYQNLAVIYFRQGEFQKAYDAIEKALEIDPTNSNLQENLKLIEAKL